MFAQDGGEGNDDPYNFDIADRYGGGGSKKGNARKAGGSKLSGGKSHQSRLKKSVLNKTVGSVPSSTPVKAQVGGWRKRCRNETSRMVVGRSFLCVEYI